MKARTIGRLGLALLLAVAVTGVSTSARAQNFSKAEATIDARLSEALRELDRERQRIAKEKLPLSREVAKLEDEVLTFRREQAQLLKLRDSRTIDLTSLRRQIEVLRDQNEFVSSRLNEFVRDFEGRLDPGELALYEEATAKAKLADQTNGLGATERRNRQLDVVALAIERASEQVGGRTFEGSALSPEGVLTAGRFVALGPTVFFSDDTGSVAGLVENQLNAADPVVVALGSGFASGIAQTATTGKGALPFDATLGKALKKEKASKGVGEYVADGGPVGLVIIGLGLLAFALIVLEFFDISRFEVSPVACADPVLRSLRKGDAPDAAREASKVSGFSGELLRTGVEHAAAGRAVLEELMFEKILRVRPALERFLPFLAITAATAPLLGLLGTVTGMIKTFQLITIFGAGDAKSLSSGISEALVTTALGLGVAIPTLILHGALLRLARQKLGLAEQLSVAFVNRLEMIRDERPAPRRAVGE